MSSSTQGVISALSAQGREAVRAKVAAHLAAKHPIEELGIEPYRPADTQDFAFVGRTPKRISQTTWYRCSFCQVDRKFSSGRIVLSSDGLLRLIGDNCWETHIDRARYKEESDDLRDYERRQRFIRLKDKFAPQLTEAIPKLHAVDRNIEVLEFIARLPQIMQREAPALFDQLQQAHRASDQLRVERSVPDALTGRFSFQHQTVHRVMGISAAIGPIVEIQRETGLAFDAALRARNAISTADFENLSNRAAAKLIDAAEADIRLALQSTNVAQTALENARTFLSAANILGMVKWSDDTDNDFSGYHGNSLERIPGGLRFNPQTGRAVDFIPPQSLGGAQMPDLTGLKFLLDVN